MRPLMFDQFWKAVEKKKEKYDLVEWEWKKEGTEYKSGENWWNREECKWSKKV